MNDILHSDKFNQFFQYNKVSTVSNNVVIIEEKNPEIITMKTDLKTNELCKMFLKIYWP